MTTTAASVGVRPSATSGRIFNFSAGPGVLPESVLEQIRQDVWNIRGSGIGILEHSHRGKVVDKVWEETEQAIRRVGKIPDAYKVLFLTGGASQQFYQIPMNFLGKDQSADYLETGVWAQKAIGDAKRYGTVHTACSSKDENFSYIPSAAQTKFTPGARYVHFTSNNTIFGTQFAAEPAVPAGTTLVCDASSDIFSRPIDVSKYALIYAGAQKNLGPAGVTLVIIREDFMNSGSKDLPALLQYRTYAENESRFNTPPVFAVYALGLVAQWIESFGGLQKMAEHNRVKASHIYGVLDSSKFWRGTARPDSRSLMNICFRGPSEDLEKKFLAEAESNGFDGLKGHRSVGGMRASVYNAHPMAGAVELAKFMRDFEQRNG